MKVRSVGFVAAAVLVSSCTLLGAFALSVPSARWVQTKETLVSDPQMTVTRTGYIEGVGLAGIIGDQLYASRHRFAYQGGIDASALSPLAVYSAPAKTLMQKVKARVGSTRVASEFEQLEGAQNIFVLRTGTMILIYKNVIYRSTDKGQTFEVVKILDDYEDAPFRYGATKTPDDEIYFGEYSMREDAPPIRIWHGSEDGRTWDVRRTFEKGEVFHVHALLWDEHRNRIWMMTGDTGNQSQISYTEDSFRSLKVLGKGSNVWNTFSLIPTKKDLYWGTYSESEVSALYRYTEATGELHKIREIGSPVWAGTQLADGTLVMSVGYQPNSDYTKKAHPPAEVSILASRDGENWKQIVRYDYADRPSPDMVDMRGTAWIELFPSVGTTRDLFFTPMYTTRDSLTLQRLSIQWHQ